MQDREFEKAVQNKMDELSLQPSDAVWEQVDRRLNKKEKRRRWIIWLPLMLTGLGIGIYVTLSNGSFRKNGQATLSSKRIITHHNIHPSSTRTIKEHKDGIAETGLKSKRYKTENNVTWQNRRNANESSRHVNQDSIGDKNLIMVTDKTRKSYQLSENILSQKTHVTSNANQRQGIEAGISIARNLTPAFITLPFQDIRPVIHVVPYRQNMRENNLLQAPVLIKHPEKWEWGITLAGGRSSVNKYKPKALPQGAMYYSVTSSFNQASSVLTQPAALQPGPALSGGIYARKKFNRRLSVSVGLNATGYTTSQLVGNKFDSSSVAQPSLPNVLPSFDSYYLTGTSDSYTNKYFYLQLPVKIQTQLFSSKSALFWEGGFSVSRLLSASALYYNQNAGVYNVKKGSLNKTRFDVITGFPVKIFKADKLALQAGPEVQYGITNLLTDKNEVRKHLLFFGLKANLRIGNIK